MVIEMRELYRLTVDIQCSSVVIKQNYVDCFCNSILCKSIHRLILDPPLLFFTRKNQNSRGERGFPMLLPAWAMRTGDYDYNLSEKKSDHENLISAAGKDGLGNQGR